MLTRRKKEQGVKNQGAKERRIRQGVRFLAALGMTAGGERAGIIAAAILGALLMLGVGIYDGYGRPIILVGTAYLAVVGAFATWAYFWWRGHAGK
jgi:hypothetical protein